MDNFCVCCRKNWNIPNLSHMAESTITTTWQCGRSGVLYLFILLTISNPVGTDQLFNVESTLIQHWASTFLNHRQHWYLVEKSFILKQWSTKNQLLNHNSNKNQPSLKLKYQCWKLVEIWLTVGWFLVELWLRNCFLFDHCFKINDFSTRYQHWYLVKKLICAHREMVMVMVFFFSIYDDALANWHILN